MSEFLREYFLRTREEIDVEKRSRDNILNVIILVLGAVGFAMFRSDNARMLMKSDEALVIALSMLITITGLFWLRHKKLHQIVDRWFVLHSLLERRLTELPISESLEAVVAEGLKGRRYSIKDVCLCAAISCPLYGLAILNLHLRPGSRPAYTAVAGIALVLGHVGIAALLMLHSFKCPKPLADAGEPIKSKQVPEEH